MAKILLIEDDAFLNKLYIDILTSIGHQPTSVMDGNSAFQQIILGGWDLILLDMILPNMNAIEILNKIKIENPDKLKQKFLVLTNLDQDPLLEKVTEFGIKYFNKGKLNPDQLTNIINDQLK